jgi:type IV fimbrial biogenesis protein FimT
MKTENGFTLIELMVALSVAAIILTVGIPNFRTLIQNNRAATQANELVGALGLARAEAVKRGLPVAICASNDSSTCTGGNDWAGGWIVFVDDNAGDPGNRNTANEALIRVHAAIGAGSTLSANDSNIRYDRLGYQESGVSTFNLKPADCSGDMKRQISMTASGGPSTKRVSC